MITRPDFERIASKLKANRPRRTPWKDEEQALIELGQWLRDVEAMAEVLETLNPRFDYERFVRACGATELMSEDQAERYFDEISR